MKTMIFGTQVGVARPGWMKNLVCDRLPSKETPEQEVFNGSHLADSETFVMQRFSRLAILTLFFAAFVSQSQTACCTSACDNPTNDSDAVLKLHRDGTDHDLASTNRRVMTGFEFLRRIDKGVIREFAKAWQISGDGMNEREGVVLIFRTEKGGYRGISQGFSNEYKSFTFRLRLDALAIVHT